MLVNSSLSLNICFFICPFLLQGLIIYNSRRIVCQKNACEKGNFLTKKTGSARFLKFLILILKKYLALVYKPQPVPRNLFLVFHGLRILLVLLYLLRALLLLQNLSLKLLFLQPVRIPFGCKPHTVNRYHYQQHNYNRAGQKHAETILPSSSVCCSSCHNFPRFCIAFQRSNCTPLMLT